MSFILEALKKAERDRTAGQAPGVEDTLRPITRSKLRREDSALRSTALAIGATLLIGGMTYALLSKRGAKPSPAVATPVAISAAPQPAPVSVPAAVTPAAASLPDAPGAAMRVDPERLQAPVAAPEVALDRPDYVVPADEAATMDELVDEAPTANRNLPPPVDAPVSSSRNTVAESAAPHHTEPDVRSLKDMPPSFRADFPKLAIEVHSYDDNPLRRFVLVNGKKYRETDTLVEGPKIIEIVPEGVIFEQRGTRVLQEILH